MPPVAFREGKSLSDESPHPLSQRVVPAFHMIGFPRPFTDGTMRLFREHGSVRFIKITEAMADAISFRNSFPENMAGSLATIIIDESHDLPGSPTHSRP